jgi:hypothetical protein
VIIEVDIYSAIRTRYSDGESIRSIAKSLGISSKLLRNTAKARPIRKCANPTKGTLMFNR